ncbi:MAG: metallophosphoesterase, partial [Clostridia bacterium]|nr:metallophosphoesterase [Clostridia bacterium]
MKKLKRLALTLLSALMIFSSVACQFLPTSSSSVIEGLHQHKTVHRTGITPNCQKVGKLEHWECVGCGLLFADKECTHEISAIDVNLTKTAHDLKKHDRVEATETMDGNIEYYTCNECGKYFSDEQGKNEITEADVALDSFANLVDFIVEVPENRNPIVLQLADPQIIDSSTMRTPDRLNAAKVEAWGPNSREERCYKYIRELVNKTKPDLVLISGDVIYGSFDDDGHLTVEFVNFMEGLDVKWAPVMGNHDVETNMGADWMCQQYENARNCLFKQGDILGNGNYTIGIKQGGELKRIFVNMDTNGCTGASELSMSNGHTVHHKNNSYGITYGTYGLQKDQVAWFEETVGRIKEFAPNVKVSFHFHIAMQQFAVAYNEAYKDLAGNPVAQVEVALNDVVGKNKVLYPERLVGHKAGDFGALIWLWQYTPDFWDVERINGEGKEHEIFNKMKAVGADSFFVGHYHSNSVSIVYDGIRYQYGQKCSTYDTTQLLSADGKISSTD